MEQQGRLVFLDLVAQLVQQAHPALVVYLASVGVPDLVEQTEQTAHQVRPDLAAQQVQQAHPASVDSAASPASVA